MSLALHSSAVDNEQDEDVQSEEFLKADELEEEESAFGSGMNYSQEIGEYSSPSARGKSSRNKANREAQDRKKQATKIWIKNVVSKRPPTSDDEDQHIGIGREYLFVAYVCSFKHHATTPGVFWTLFTELFSELKAIHKNPRIKLSRPADIEVVFPGLKKNQIPCHQDERFRYLPCCELKPFMWTDWRLDNPAEAQIMESIFGPEGPPQPNIEEIRSYFLRRRDHEFEAFYNPWNPAANPRPKRPEYQQEHIAAKRKRERIAAEEEAQLKYDIWESPKQYYVVFDAPGVDPNQIQVSLFPTFLKVNFPKFQYEQGFMHNNAEFSLIHSGRAYNQLEGEKQVDCIIQLPGHISVSNKEHRHVINENGSVRMRIQKDLSYTENNQLGSHDD